MTKTIQLLVNTGKEDDNQTHEFVQGSGAKGKPTRVKAVKGARYQLKELANREVGPEYIRSKRVGKNLHVSLDGSDQADLIIEGYYEEGYLAEDSTGLFGRAEDGQIYEYIPEDPTPSGLAANLTDGAMPVSQVLGGIPIGEAFALSGLPLLAAAGGGLGGLLAGAALVTAAAVAANRNNNTTASPISGLSADSDTGSSSTDGITNNKTPSYTGKAAAGSTVEVTINGKTYTTVADANGNYTVKIPASDALPDGTYAPKIKVTSTNGSISNIDGAPFTVDTSTSGIGSLTHDAANDTGSNTSDGITGNTKPSFSGTGEPGATVKVMVDGQTLTTVVKADGTWVATGPYTGNGLTGGQHAVVITFTDVAGNTSTVSAEPVFINTGVGNITISVDQVTADNTISGAEANLNGNTYITGKASGEFKAGQVVTLTINGKTFSGPVDAKGVYKISVPTSDLIADSDKTIAASIAVTDTAGNAGVVSTTHPYLVDNSAPNKNTTTLTIDSVTADNIIVGAENITAATTNITGKAFGEFQQGDTVTLSINGKTFIGSVGANGSYSIAVPVNELAADGDTKIEATLVATDHAGNTGTIAAAHTYVVDTVGPNSKTTVLVIDPVTEDNVISGSDTAANINITGKASGEFKAGDKVFFSLSGTRYEGVVATDGTFSIPVAKTDLIGNTGKVINASLLATDANGNQGTVTNDQPYVVDVNGPDTSTTSVTVNPVTADNLINSAEAAQPSIAITGRVSGEFKAGDVVTLAVNGKAFTGSAAADGSYSIAVTTTDLIADSHKTIVSSVMAHDAAGNVGNVVGNAQTFIVDNAGPNATSTTLVIDAITTDNIINIAESRNTNFTVTGKVVGEFTSGDTVTLTVNGHNYTSQVAANGTYSTSIPTSDFIGDNAKTITGSIAAHDAVGNVAQAGAITATRQYIVDVTPPDVNPSSAAINVDPVTTDNIINAAESNSTIAITGKVTGEFKTGDIVTLVINGTSFSAPVTSTGAYSIDVSGAALAADPDKTIVASVAAHDAADNVGAVSNTHIYAVDTGLPVISLSVNPVTADNVINLEESGKANTAVTGKATGNFSNGDTVTLTINGKSFIGTVNTTGDYSINVPTFDLVADGDKTIAAQITTTSTAGNVNTVATTHTYNVDATAPNATSTTLTVDVVTPDNIINGTEGALTAANIPITGKVAGTFTAGDTVTLKLTSLGTTKTFIGFVAADGSYSINVPAADLVADADKTIAASIDAHDSAGNVGTISSTRTYAVETTPPSSDTTALSIDPVTADNIINFAENGVANTTITGKVTGEFKSGDQVTLIVNGSVKTGTVDAAGNFSISVPTSDLATDPDKTIAASIAATDAAGNVASLGSINATHTYVVDTTPPTNTALRIDAITADDIINATEAGGANLAITGKATGEFATGDVVTLTVNGKTYSGSVVADGSYSISVPTADLRADADLKIDGSILAHDAVGNSATFTSSRPYLFDTTGPSSSTTALSVNVIATDDTINANESGQTSIPVTGQVAGEFVAGDVVTLTVNGKTFTGQVDTSGNYSIPVTTADLIANSGKTIAASIVAHDAVGNAGTISATHPYLVDTTAPSDSTTTISVNAVTPDNVINSTEAGVATTAVSGTVAGEYTVGDIVTITVNGHTATGNVGANGIYTVDVLTSDLVAETAKILTASVAAHDAAGNVGNVSANHRYAIGTTVPNGGAALGLTIDNDINNDGTIGYTELFGAATLSVTATFDKTKVSVGDAVTFTPDSGTAQTVTLTQAMVDAGKVSTTFATPSNGSSLNVTAVLSDVAGNATLPATDSAFINGVNPNATATIDISAITTDSGTAGDFITNDTTLTYSGTLTGFTSNGNKVKVELLDATGNVVETQTVTPSSATSWAFTPTAAQASGNYTLRATIVDSSGTRVNTTAPVNGTGGGQDTQLIVIDDSKPTNTVNITAISEDKGVSSTDFITSDNNGLTVSATLLTALAAGEKLFYSKDNGVTWTDITGSVSGTAVSYADAQLTSTTTVQMRVQDGAGNAGVSDSQLITIDTAGPTPVVSPEDPLNPPAGKASLILDSVTTDNIVNSAEGAQTQVAITGKARGEFTTGDTVTLTVNNKTFTGQVAANGTFSINVPGSDLLADADRSVAASLAAHDTAGNVGSVTDIQAYEVDTLAPTTTVNITAISEDRGVSSTDFITSDNNGLTVSATLLTALAAGEKLFYSKDNGVTWTDITGSVSGTAVSYADAQLTSTTTVQMRVQDGAGNAGVSDSQLITIDTAGPTPVVSPDDPLNPPAGKASLILDSVTTDNIVNSAEGAQPQVAITGKARGEFTTGDTVTLMVNNKTFTGQVAANGTFSINVPGSDLLADADRSVGASLAAHDTAGNVGLITDDQVYTVNTAVPTTTVNITAITDDTGLDQNDFVTNDSNGLTVAATLSTTLSTGEKLFYSKDNGVTWTDITSSVIGRNVSYADAQLTSTTTVQMRVQDAIGNAGAADSQLITIDTVAPTITAAVTAVTDNVGGFKGTVTKTGLTDDQSPDVSGSLSANLSAGERVQIFDNGTLIGTAVATVGTATWSYADTRTLADGYTAKYTARVIDTAGNPGPLETVNGMYAVTVRLTSPVITITSIAGDAVTASSSGTFDAAERGASATTVVTKPVISGTTTNVDPGQTVTVTLNGVNHTTTVQTGGGWSVSLTDSEAIALNHGNTYNVTASVADLVGNTAIDNNNSLVVNTAGPDTPTVVNTFAGTTTPILTGSAQKLNGSNAISLADGDTITIVLNGITVAATVDSTPGRGTNTAGVSYDKNSRTWSLDTSVVNFALTNNTTFPVSVTVEAGGTSKPDVSTNELVIRTAAPTITLDAIATDDIINIAEHGQALTLTGTTTAEVGSTVTFTNVAGTHTTTVIAGTGGNNLFSVALTAAEVASISAGATAHASVTNLFSKTASADRAFTLDTTAPTITSSNTAAKDENISTTEVVYTVTTNELAGAVTFGLSGTDANKFDIDSTGKVTLKASPNFETKSSYSFNVLAIDAAGNTTSKAVTLTINNVDEVAPSILSAASASVNENVAANTVVYTAQSTDTDFVSPNTATSVIYSLKAGVGDVAKFSINSSTGAVTLIESPNFENKPSYTFTVIATDAANNASEKAVTINVANVNEAPVGVNDTAAATEAGGVANGIPGTNPTGNVLTNDTDVDANDTKTVQDVKAGSGTVSSVTAGTTSSTGTSLAGSYGTVKIGADGSYAYTVDNSNTTVQALKADSPALQDVFTYTVKDAAGLTSTATLTVSVNGANDAPVLTDTTLVLAAVAQNAATPSGTVGTAVSNLIGGITDVDSPNTGIAITGVSNGTLYFTTNGGTSWTAYAGTPSATNALLLDGSNANARIYFKPNAGYYGTVSNAVTFSAWDESTGTAGSYANTTASGASAYSAATDTISEDVIRPVTITTLSGKAVTGSDTVTMNQSMPLTGTANPNATVTLDVNGTTHTVQADASGNWNYAIKAEPAVRYVMVRKPIDGTYPDPYAPNGIFSISGIGVSANGQALNLAGKATTFGINATTQGSTSALTDSDISTVMEMTSIGNENWVQVDLGAYYRLDSITINGKTGWGSRLNGATIYTSGDNMSGMTTAQLTAATGSTVTAYTPPAGALHDPSGPGTTAVIDYTTATLNASATTNDPFINGVNTIKASESVSGISSSSTETLTWQPYTKIAITSVVDGTTAQGNGTSFCNKTPTFTGKLTGPLATGQVVEIWEDNGNGNNSGWHKIGTATVLSSGTDWTWTVPSTAPLTAGTFGFQALVVVPNVSAVQTSSTFNVTILSTPLVLDLNGDGVQTTSVTDGTQFDLLNTGKKANVGWVNKHDGLLAMDLNGDGVISNGAELFGDQTVLPNGTLAENGWVALNAQDTNGDGKIDGADANFDKLRVWVDANGNGVTDGGELHTLADEHIASINLNHDASNVPQNGNLVQMASSFTTTDGATHAIADVGFQVNSMSGVYGLSNGSSFDLANLSNAAQVSTIDMASDAAANTVKLTLSDVLGTATTNGVHQLKLMGGANDSANVNLPDWINTGTTVVDAGHTYEVFNANSTGAAQLLIDQAMLNANHVS